MHIHSHAFSHPTTSPPRLEVLRSCAVAIMVLTQAHAQKDTYTHPLTPCYFCRLEVLRSCAVAIMVLTQAYVTSRIYTPFNTLLLFQA